MYNAKKRPIDVATILILSKSASYNTPYSMSQVQTVSSIVILDNARFFCSIYWIL